MSCRTSVCPGVGTSQVCTPPEPGDCGTPIFWPGPCVGWSLQERASSQVTFAEAERSLRAAFETWMRAECPGGGAPRIAAVELPASVCDEHEYNQDAGNANIVLFHDSGWPYDASQLALTTVTYDTETGAIYDADMELNSERNHFTVGDGEVETDLLSIVTHEAGHFLGLAHAPDFGATMSPGYIPGSTTPRTLAADDVAGICAIYPPGPVSTPCDPTPRHGFSTSCADQQTRVTVEVEGGCRAAPAGAPTGAIAGALALSALALAARRARSRVIG